jgi:hypothetical protein
MGTKQNNLSIKRDINLWISFPQKNHMNQFLKFN